MLFDDGSGPIRDLAWLDPDGKLRAEMERHRAWKQEDGIEEKRDERFLSGLCPVSVKFTEEGPVEFCSIPGFRLLAYRVLTLQWEAPTYVGCCPDGRGYSSPEAVRYAIEKAYAWGGLKTPYTDTFPVWDRSSLRTAEARDESAN